MKLHCTQYQCSPEVKAIILFITSASSGFRGQHFGVVVESPVIKPIEGIKTPLNGRVIPWAVAQVPLTDAVYGISEFTHHLSHSGLVGHQPIRRVLWGVRELDSDIFFYQGRLYLATANFVHFLIIALKSSLNSAYLKKTLFGRF